MLQHFGVDLAVWWKQRRWRALLELIEQLPHASRLWEARLNDDEEAERILDQMEKDEEKSSARNVVAIREHDRTSVQLEDLKEQIANLTNTVRGIAGGKPIRHRRDHTQTLIESKTWERDVESAAPILEQAGFDPSEAGML